MFCFVDVTPDGRYDGGIICRDLVQTGQLQGQSGYRLWAIY